MNPRPLLRLALALLLSATLAHAEITLIRDGQPQAVIVLPNKPTPVAKYAAGELAAHIKKASGADLPIVAENAIPAGTKSRLFIGPSSSAQALLKQSALPAEGCTLRTAGADLAIAGDDGPGDALDPDTRAGTLWGVYEWLERDLHVRWLWPGDLGTFVPPAHTIVAHDIDETVSPRFFQRKLRPGLGWTSDHPALGFTAAAAEEYAQAQSIFLRRHRMGRSLHASYGHAFTDWWKKYGAAHPDWFQLREDGKRGPAKPTSRFSMCVSSPGLAEQIVANWDAKRAKATGGPSFVNACENDILGSCTCEACQAWDGPAPADYLKYYSPTSKMAGSRFVSDRYAHFWLNVQQLAAQRDPNATVIGYVYFNYFQAPTSGLKLNDHVLLGYCPSGGFFPRSADEHAWMKQQWDGWRATGAQLFIRTNHLLDGYCMPYIFAHQFADEFQHAAKNGMVATDFDSLTGHWATQGPNLYAAVRLHTHPDAPIDAVLAEYYSSFGPAAAAVKAYFDYWENFTTQSREQISKSFEETQTSRWRTFAKAAHLVFTSESFAPAEKLLAQAATAAARDPAAAARVDFLRQGLTHAQLCARVAAQLTLAHPTATPAETTKALGDLIAFRRAHEKSWIDNMNHLAWVEDLSWKLSDDVKKAPDLYP
jgi:hypothetical protein